MYRYFFLKFCFVCFNLKEKIIEKIGCYVFVVSWCFFEKLIIFKSIWVENGRCLIKEL